MKEELITFETAKFAKEKGFNNPTVLSCWLESRDPKWNNAHTQRDKVPYIAEGCDFILQPTQSLLQRWLREIHGIQVYVVSHTVKSLNMMQIYRDYVAYINGNELNDARDEEYQTYEQALEFGLFEALKHVS